MRRRSREAGEGQAGCLFGIVLLVIAIFIAWKVIPIKANMSDLRQTVEDESKSAGQHGDAQITQAILEKAEREHLPVTQENIEIRRTGNEISIDVDYTVPVQFPGYLYQWHQHHHAENPIF
jgi:hypothetical protein